MVNKSQTTPWENWIIVGNPIGTGKYGTVYRIEREICGEVETSAMKVISIPKDQSELNRYRAEGYNDSEIKQILEGYLEKTVGEYSKMAELKGHANIVTCHDCVVEEKTDEIGWQIYIRMELLTPLYVYINEQNKCNSSFSEKEILQLGKDVCRALIACENNSIVHRDIKPDNILVSETGIFKLGDFGTARSLDRTITATKAGTEEFMAPEIIKGERYNKSVDIYSLGLVLYWLMNKKKMPFEPLSRISRATEKQEAYYSRINGKQLPKPLNGSASLKRVVMKACAYDAGSRFQSAAEMLAELNKISENEINTAIAKTNVKVGHIQMDWSDVKDESHKRIIMDVASPWEDYSKELESTRTLDSEQDSAKSSTMSFIEILQKELQKKHEKDLQRSENEKEISTNTIAPPLNVSADISMDLLLPGEKESVDNLEEIDDDYEQYFNEEMDSLIQNIISGRVLRNNYDVIEDEVLDDDCGLTKKEESGSSSLYISKKMKEYNKIDKRHEKWRQILETEDKKDTKDKTVEELEAEIFGEEKKQEYAANPETIVLPKELSNQLEDLISDYYEPDAPNEAIISENKQFLKKTWILALIIIFTLCALWIYSASASFKYKIARYDYEKGDYETAISILDNLHGYKDSEIFINKIYSTPDYWHGVHVYSTVQIGRYIQDYDKQSSDYLNEPIQWLVLEKNKDEVLLVSEKILDYSQYALDSENNFSWEDCCMRDWLRNFYLVAFNNDESKCLEIIDQDDQSEDYVSILSKDDINKYFERDSVFLECEPTDYLRNKQDITSNSCEWWIKTETGIADYDEFLEKNIYNAMYVDESGDKNCRSEADWPMGVRPVIRVNIDKMEKFLA